MAWKEVIPEWINTPYRDDYYPFIDWAYPFLIENDNVDWQVRTPV